MGPQVACVGSQPAAANRPVGSLPDFNLAMLVASPFPTKHNRSQMAATLSFQANFSPRAQFLLGLCGARVLPR